MSRFWLDLGSNIQREESLRQALSWLEQQFDLLRSSRVYESPPYGFADQDSFYNVCLEAQSDLSVDLIRQRLRQGEDQLGRQRGPNKNGPRNIDMDLILHETARDPKLPHPQVESQIFVLLPLCELIPDTLHPTAGLTFQEMLDRFPRQPGDIHPVEVEGFPYRATRKSS